MSALRVGVLGTSWWVDAMYLPSLVGAGADVVVVAGRNAERAARLASAWDIAEGTTADALLARDDLDAVVIATPDDSHRDLAVAAFERGWHVLVEKPLAPDLDAAREIADAATAAGTTTLVPFTYRYMPTARWLHRLVSDGWVGQPYHVALRYHTGYARDGRYAWRFDHDAGGRGVLYDLGSHWLDQARWLVGEVTEVSAREASHVPRGPRPDGTSYRAAADSALVNLRFASGATGTVEVLAVSHEGDGFGQRHEIDLIGSGGTLRMVNDWRQTQLVTGLQDGDPGPARELPVPEDIWGRARRTDVHDTYRDVFRRDGLMVGDFVRAAAAGRPCEPDVATGLRVQELLDAAERSAASDGRSIPV